MKKQLLTAVIALTGLAAFSSANAQSTYTTGDALLSFRATGGTGASTNLQIDLGNLNGAFSSFSLDQSALASVISSVYGSGWASRNDLYWGVIGSDDNTGNAVWSLNSTPGAVQGADLATINASVDNQYVAGTQGNATQGTLNDNNSVAHYYSSYNVNNTGSFTQNDAAGYNVLSYAIGSLYNPKGLYAFTYTDPGTYANPVQTGTISQSGGVFTVSAVPEPSTYILFGLGALLFVIAVRRKSQNS